MKIHSKRWRSYQFPWFFSKFREQFHRFCKLPKFDFRQVPLCLPSSSGKDFEHGWRKNVRTKLFIFGHCRTKIKTNSSMRVPQFSCFLSQILIIFVFKVHLLPPLSTYQRTLWRSKQTNRPSSKRFYVDNISKFKKLPCIFKNICSKISI